MTRKLSIPVLFLIGACGSGQPQGGGTLPKTGGDTPPVGVEPVATTDAGVADAAPPPKPLAPISIILKNDGKSDLTFAIDQGWGQSIFAYSGKPPKAKPILLFPRHCTGACDAPAGEVCPVCTEADNPRERQKQEKAETQRQIVAAGASFAIDWDGLAHVYSKAPPEVRGKNKKCECWARQAPPAESYTIKACGLRTASEAGKTSKMTCVEGTVALPVAEGQHVDVTLTFP